MLTMTSKLHVIYLWPYFLLFFPPSLSSSRTGSLLAPEYIKHVPPQSLCNGNPLCLKCLLVPLNSIRVCPWPPVDLGSYIIFSQRPVLFKTPRLFPITTVILCLFLCKALSLTYPCSYISIFLLQEPLSASSKVSSTRTKTLFV